MASIPHRHATTPPARGAEGRPWDGEFRRRREPWPAQAPWGVLGLVLVAGLVVFLYFFQWNWLRGPLAHEIGARLDRQVRITGNLGVRLWSWTPTATVEGLVVGNPAWAGNTPMATFRRLSVSVHIPDLLHGRLVLPIVRATGADVQLARDGAGRANWNFGAGAARPLKLPTIQRLLIENSRLTIDDVSRQLRFAGSMSSNETLNGGWRGPLLLDGAGDLHRVPFSALIRGGPMLNIAPDRPYPFVASLRSGATRIEARGVVPHPFDLNRFSGQLHITGEDLSQLYHLTGLALPATPPYELSAGFARVRRNLALRDLRGRFGESDLAGAFEVDDNTGRPFVIADLVSRRLRLTDLAAIVGGGAHAANGPVSPAQAAMAAKLSAERRILPDARLPLARVRAMDAKVMFRAETVESKLIPIRRLSMRVDLDHGVLAVNPLALTLPQGAVTGDIRVDARGSTARERADLRLAGARVEELLNHDAANPAMEGPLLARAQLAGTGDSIREAAATSSGEVSLVIPHGQIRQQLAELMGINVTKSLFMFLGHDESQTPLRCAVASFRDVDGVMTTRQMVLDTGVVLATGSGNVNLRDETVDLRLSGKPKKFRLVRIAAPITLTGRLAHPRFGVDLAAAAPQLSVAAILGALVAPLAAILPFVDLGLAHDADCGSLLAWGGPHRGSSPVPR